MIEKKVIFDIGKWQVLLSKMNFGDFYHTPSYHHLDLTGHPVLLSFKKKSEAIIMPLIVRQIPNSNYFDATSVYGYAGPLWNKTEISEDTKSEFQKFLNEFFVSNKIIAAFSRLHPLIVNQDNIFSGYGEVLQLNKTVSINTTAEPHIQRQYFDKSLKNRLNQIRKKGIVVKKANTLEEINQFVNIYLETMERVNANKMYFFDLDYFMSFLNSKEYESFVLLAIYQDEIIAGSLFTIYRGIMQYHLSGTKNIFLNLAPMKLLVDEARSIATDLGLQHFHLGGGFGGQNDTLFEFKAAFSKDFYQFKIWRKIIDERIYKNLVKNKFGNSAPESNYFPLYRFEP